MKTSYVLRLLIGPDEMNNRTTSWSIFDKDGEKDARGGFVGDPIATGHKGGRPKAEPTSVNDWRRYAQGSGKVSAPGYRLAWAEAELQPLGPGEPGNAPNGAIIDIPALKLGRWGDS